MNEQSVVADLLGFRKGTSGQLGRAYRGTEDGTRYGPASDPTWEAMKQPLLEMILGLAPGSGEAMSAEDSGKYTRRAIEDFRQGDYGAMVSDGAGALAAGLGALPLVGGIARGVGGAAKTGAALIKDWRWRPAQEVQQELGLTKIPPHVEEFGDFMKEQAGRATAGDLGPRDLIKAFTTTRASIQRQGVQADKVRAAGLPLADDVTGKVRPEGAFAEWLFTPSGQRYLNAAERGEVDDAAIAEAVKIMAPFGKHETDIPKAMRSAALEVGPRASEAQAIIARVNAGEPGAIGEWREFAKSLPGIGPAKQGFVGSLVGNGALPTLDARQIKAHTGRPTKEADKYLDRRSGRGADAAVDRLARRQEAMNLEVREDLRPFYQHLTHHAVWDKAGNEVTTHADLVRAMRLAGIGGAGVLGASLLPGGEAQAAPSTLEEVLGVR